MTSKLCVTLDPKTKELLDEHLAMLRRQGYNITKSTLVSKIVTDYITKYRRQIEAEKEKREQKEKDPMLRYIEWTDPFYPRELKV